MSRIKKGTYTHVCVHVMINVPKKSNHDAGSQKVVVGVVVGNCGEEQGAGRGTRGLSEGTAESLGGGYIGAHKCQVTKMNTYDLCMLLYANYS